MGPRRGLTMLGSPRPPLVDADKELIHLRVEC